MGLRPRGARCSGWYHLSMASVGVNVAYRVARRTFSGGGRMRLDNCFLLRLSPRDARLSSGIFRGCLFRLARRTRREWSRRENQPILRNLRNVRVRCEFDSSWCYAIGLDWSLTFAPVGLQAFDKVPEPSPGSGVGSQINHLTRATSEFVRSNVYEPLRARADISSHGVNITNQSFVIPDFEVHLRIVSGRLCSVGLPTSSSTPVARNSIGENFFRI